ncbi:MAG: hypothetical protein M3Z04_05675 [Chloroflexota bacterium]|nr:hypothetical protein [Chloroflexota bacterium]
MPIRLPPGRALIFLALGAALGLSVLPLGPARHSSYFFSETGHAVSGRFLDTWIGGHTYTESIQLNGYPISDPITQTSALDGRPYRVQWFQRVRLEAHPSQAPPNDVLLGQLGRESGVPTGAEAAFARLPAPPGLGADGQWFPETGHLVRGPFRAFWQQYGGRAQFGYPISEEFTQHLSDRDFTVQYFERSRLERPTGPSAVQDVTLGLLGLALYQPPAGTPTPVGP